MTARTVRAILAYASFLLLAFAFIMLARGQIDGTVRDVVMVLVGAIITQSKEVFGFFFGTSQSSHEKTEAMRSIAENAGTDGERDHS